MTDARTLAKATAAATRAAPLVSAMARLTEGLGLTIERQANAVLEELDLLRHFLREALLAGVIAGQAAPPPLDVPAHVAAMLDEHGAAARSGAVLPAIASGAIGPGGE